MAEFYEVLKRAVGALPGNTGDARRAVYERARKALIAQLEGFSPPLTPSEITSQRLSLEEAIRKVEGEAARAALGLGQSTPARPAAPPPGPGHASAKAYGQTPPQTAGQTSTLDRGAPQPEPRSPQSDAPSAGSLVAPPSNGGADRPPAAAAVTPDSAGSADPQKAPEITGTVSKPPVVPSGKDSGSDSAGAKDAGMSPVIGPAAAAPVDVSTGNAQIPPLASEAEPRLDSPQGTTNQPANDGSDLQSPLEAGGFEAFPQEIKTSRLPMIAGGLAAVLVVIGLSAVLYSQRDAIFGGEQAQVENAEAEKPATEVAKVEPETKAPSRVESPPPEKSTDRIPQSSGVVRTVPTQRVIVPSGAENGALNPARTEALDNALTPGTGDQPAAQTGTPSASDGSEPAATEVARTEPAATANTAGAVAQTAILYEEGSAGGAAGSGEGKAVNGQVVWGKQKDGAVSAVLADVAIPDKASNVKITIKPNTEDGFPASHLVEMQFSGPLGTSIRTVPGLIMKATEQAQGDALVGAAIKVTDGLFWIALSAEDKDLNRNKSLLESRGWIDIPLLYASGKRAILTVEKGVPGGQAIDTAFKEWAN